MDLKVNLAQASPRLSPRPTRWTSWLIWGGAVLLFGVLFAQAFIRPGLAAWSVGVVYVAYDTALLFFVFVKTRNLWPDKPAYIEPKKNSHNKGTLTTIIAAHNEADVLETTIEALRNQDHAPDQIIIADDGSTDKTSILMQRVYALVPPEIETLSSPSPNAPQLQWLRLSHAGKAQALNAAIAIIETDYIVTVDADTVMEPGAIADMRKAFDTEENLVAATGILKPICGHNLSGQIFQWFQTYEYVRNFLSRYAWMELNSLLLISGAFACFRRTPLLTVGGFDPACYVEDYEVIHRLHRYSTEHDHHWTIRVIGNAQASTDAPSSLMPFLRQRRRWFAGFLQTQYWNRDMIGNPSFHNVGTAMLPIKALDTIQPLYGLAAFALLIFFTATGTFSVALPIVIVMLVKVVIDLAWLLFSLRLYHRWTNQKLSPLQALGVALCEPISFQLLRHIGAAWGWLFFLTKRQNWGKQKRAGIVDRMT